MKRRQDGGIVYSPTDLIRFMESPFASFMERLRLEDPERAVPDELGDQDRLVMKKGVEHEEQFLRALEEEGRDLCWIEPGSGAVEDTVQAIEQGREVIYQAALARDGFQGYADFLFRDEKGGHYEPWDTKLARSPRPYYLIQLCCYADMLEGLQDRLPERVSVVFGTNEVRSFRTEDYFFYYRRLRRAFLEQMGSFDPNEPPFPDPRADHGRWQSHAERILEEEDHLCRVAGIRGSQIRRLGEAEIETMTALAQSELARVPGLDETVYSRLRTQASLQLASVTEGRPAFDVVRPQPEDPRRGLAILPPASSLDVFFDIEGYPLLEGGLEYLFGACLRREDEIVFHEWWAHDRRGEREALEGFVDWVVELRGQDPTMHVYHYAAYEVSALRRLMGRHATREDEVDDLLRGEVFVDLYRVVREGIIVGEPGYSIKNVESLYRERREGEVADAGASIVAYERWLQSGEPTDWRRSPLLRSIRDYNRDDCESLVDLADWLRERRRESGIGWVPSGSESNEEDDTKELPPEIVERRELARRLLDAIPASEEERRGEAEKWRVQELLAHLLEFHRRESKPVWWALFDRREMSAEELFEDINCLGDLVRESDEPVHVRSSRGYWYRFDARQDTKIKEGSRVYLVPTLETVRGKVEEMVQEGETGRALLVLGPTALGQIDGEPPQRISLIPDEFVSPKALETAIHAVVDSYEARGDLPPALRAFLHREVPRIAGHDVGPILAPDQDPCEVAVRIADELDETTLCIQGPPGSGKTYTAALMIEDLLERGRSVGVVSNSHKAILNLMRAVGKRVGPELEGIKVGGPEDELFESHPGVLKMEPKDALACYDGGLIGGTAWFFAKPEMEGRLDHLFVDEAGQVSVANLVAVSRSARNLVLLGDQMQLGQPIQGSHPGESGLSALEYLLEDHATIPPELGIFLATTWRLHPEICRFISGAVYENRLRPKDHTEKRILVVPADADLVGREAGILFVPVEHEGNTQASEEEAEVIREITEEILGRVWSPGGEEEDRPLDLEDILYVAPYNMQVHRLRELLPPGARVGSVDKFQGQEAPVVLCSMCSSSGETGTRGLGFLLDPNRLNVALSRAKTLAIVVGDPRLTLSSCSSIEDMRRLNLFCRIVKAGSVSSEIGGWEESGS